MAADHPSVTPASEGCARGPLVDAVTTFLARDHAPDLDPIRASVERVVDEAGPDAIAHLSHRLSHAGSDWDYYPMDPLARQIHRVLAERVLDQPPALHGRQHLDAVGNRPVVLCGNHLSYSDANVLDVVLQREGAVALANRLTVVVGPKVYSDLRRRFSSLCFGTIKVPQSSTRSSEEAVMSPRDVAHAARRSITIAHERLSLGEALLVFPEGSRSRTATMQRFLAGAARYLEGPDVSVLPLAITGTETLFPFEADGLHAVPMVVSVGRPLTASVLRDHAGGDRQVMMDVIALSVAALLPAPYQGVYEGQDVDLGSARRVWSELVRQGS